MNWNLTRLARALVSRGQAVPEIDIPDARNKAKVFGIGMSKTGTTTLGTCFRVLGYQHTDFDFDMLGALVRGDVERVLKKTEQFDAFEDAPWFMLYKEVDFLYPNCRFVLTVRRDAARWVKSALAHDARQNAKGTKARNARELFVKFYQSQGLGSLAPGELYEFHNRSVLDYFSGREGKLLTVCWETGDGWKKLCDFLGKPVPSGLPFPHENAAPTENHPSRK